MTWTKEVPVVCPTHGRPDRVKALDVFPEAILCVAESQEPAYRENYPDAKYLVHPDSVKGLPPKRNWIYEQLGDVFMVDDDIAEMWDVTGGRGEFEILQPPRPWELVQRTADTARQLGVYLFGFSQWPDPSWYKPWKPFHLTGFVGGSLMGLLEGSDLFWHPKSGRVEDFFISLLNAHKHRMIFSDYRYVLSSKRQFGKLAGGQAANRTRDSRKEDYLFLREHFGDVIRMKPQVAYVAGVGKRQIKDDGPWEPVINLPY